MNQELRQAAVLAQAKEALELAHSFIRDGVEFGYIKDTTTPDWRAALRDTRAALSALSAVLETPTDEARSGSGVPARPTLPGELHAAILNLPCNQPGWLENSGEFGAYDAGHSDARHAAADLALAASPLPQEGRAAISAYTIDGDPRRLGSDDIRIERAKQIEGPALWAVRQMGNCLNKSGEWEYEPMPSSRDDDFLARCRFPTAEAAIEAAHGIAIAGTQGEQKP